MVQHNGPLNTRSDFCSGSMAKICFLSLVTQRGRYSLPYLGMYTNTIQALSGVLWVSRDHKLPVERQYLGFLLYHQL